MNIVIFDTETIGLEKCFCYNIGYVIANADTQEVLVKRDYVVEQIWHNLPLFETAYYAEKRPLYVSAMRGKRTSLEKFGYICQKMRRDFIQYSVEYAFAYNSPFDDRVFQFNCDWFKCINPFDTIPIRDIRGYAQKFIVNEKYRAFCEEYELFTDSGNYSTTAENIYRFITNNLEFNEEHTALSDSEIEMEILFKSIDNGANISEEVQAVRSIPRNIEKDFAVIDRKTKAVLFSKKCSKIRASKDRTKIEIE